MLYPAAPLFIVKSKNSIFFVLFPNSTIYPKRMINLYPIGEIVTDKYKGIAKAMYFFVSDKIKCGYFFNHWGRFFKIKILVFYKYHNN